MNNMGAVADKATILLIDDHPMLRNGVKQLLSLDTTLTVVGEAGDGIQGVKLAEELDPDLILLDLNMPGMNGFETLDQLRLRSLSGRIVVFSVSNYSDDHRLKTRSGWLSLKRHGARRAISRFKTSSRRENGG